MPTTDEHTKESPDISDNKKLSGGDKPPTKRRQWTPHPSVGNSKTQYVEMLFFLAGN